MNDYSPYLRAGTGAELGPNAKIAEQNRDARTTPRARECGRPRLVSRYAPPWNLERRAPCPKRVGVERVRSRRSGCALSLHRGSRRLGFWPAFSRVHGSGALFGQIQWLTGEGVSVPVCGSAVSNSCHAFTSSQSVAVEVNGAHLPSSTHSGCHLSSRGSFWTVV